MALTKVTYAMIEGEVANVLDFGAVGDGVADDTAAIQAACTAGKNVLLPLATSSYLVSNSINLQNGQNIFIEGSISSANTNPVFSALGSLGSTYTASAGAAKGDLTIALTSVTGLVIGDYLTISEGTPALSGMYRIANIASLVVTLDRYLDFAITVAAVIKEVLPISVNIIGNKSSTVTLSNSYPKLFVGSYLINSSVTNLIVNCTNSVLATDATVSPLIYGSYAYGLNVLNNEIVGLSGGTEFSGITIDYSSNVFVDNNAFRSFDGASKGIEFRYSSSVSATNNKLYKVPGSGVGAIFVYYTNNFTVNNNQILGTVYNGAGSSGSGVQITHSNYGSVSCNLITDIFGIGAIYLSGGTTGSNYINIVGNTITRNAAGTNDHLSAIHLRVGTNIAVFGNKINYTTDQIAIWSRGVTTVSIVGNEVNTVSRQPILFDKAGSDPATAEYYPVSVYFASNKVFTLTSSATVTFLATGTLSSDIIISNNELNLQSTSTGSSNKWALLLDGSGINVLNNKIVAGFGVGSTNSIVFQSVAAITNSIVQNNVIEASNDTAVFTTSGTGVVGSNNLYNRVSVYGFRAGAPVIVSAASLTALKYGATGSRPTLTTNDAGFMFYDTTTVSIVTWSGTAWV
jgi:hypothetical protein